MNKNTVQTLTEQAYARLRSDILSCRLRPQDKLKISELCSRLGYSLGAIREALARLTSEGLVIAETNKGYHVAPITRDELEDITQTRILIECQCLANAISNGNLKWETGIVSTLFELSRSPLQAILGPKGISEEWVAAHSRFHIALVAACDSPWLLRLRDILYVQSERYRSLSFQLDRDNRELNNEHQALADACLARDSDAACRAMREHLNKTTKILIEAGVVDTLHAAESEAGVKARILPFAVSEAP